MKILFLHGWYSTPGGSKPTYLRNHGHELLNPALPDDDFDAAVRIAQAEFDRHQPDVVVGSSRGAAVAMNIDSGDTPLVLLCPAWKIWGTATTVKPGTVILHSPADKMIPFADSQELLRNSSLPESTLVAVGTDHRLADPESLRAMLEAVERAATQTQLTKTDKRRPLLTPKGLGCALAFALIPVLSAIGMLMSHLIPVLSQGGIQVTIRNTGSRPLGAVVLYVTGASHNLGGIAPGTSAQTTVSPRGESHLEIEFTDENGKRERLNAGGYFEPGYRGTIRVSIKHGAIDENEQEICVR